MKMSEISEDAARGFLACLFPGLTVHAPALFPVGMTTRAPTAFRRFHARTTAAAPGRTKRIIATAAQIVAVAAATPQERAAAAVPQMRAHRASVATTLSAVRRSADDERWCWN